MRTILVIALVAMVTAAKAQTYFPGSYMNNGYRGIFANNLRLHDSSSLKTWSLSKYGAISTSYAFFRGGSASILSAPIGLQLNRRLNDNLYAFAGVSVAPSYVNFNRSFIPNDFNKANQNNLMYRPGGFGIYSRAELGLQYINDDKTFSISGSIGVERSTYPILPYNPVSNTRPNQAMPANR